MNRLESCAVNMDANDIGPESNRCLTPSSVIPCNESQSLQRGQKMNLFDEAAKNSAHLESRFDHIKSTLSPIEITSVEKFVRGVKDYGLVAINMRQTVLIAFLTTNEYQNMYEWAEWVSGISIVRLRRFSKRDCRIFMSVVSASMIVSIKERLSVTELLQPRCWPNKLRRLLHNS